MSAPQTQQEIDKAWDLWKSLNDHADALWDRYSEAFIDFIYEGPCLEHLESTPLGIEDEFPF